METSTPPAGRVPCPGCPIYPHIPDEEFRFPSCELCHWPAVGIGPVHAWRCAYCRHLNAHGGVRPRVTTAMLRLADIGTAARRLEVDDPLYGRYLVPRPRLGPCQLRPPIRPQHAATRCGGPHAGVFRHRFPPRDRTGRPVYARATVAGLPVLIGRGGRAGRHEPAGPGAVGATRNVSRSQATWLTTSAPMGMPAAASADQYAPATPAAPNRVKFPVAT